jgi:hypothetical protein
MDEIYLILTESEFASILKKYGIEPTKKNLDLYYYYRAEIINSIEQLFKEELHRIAKSNAQKQTE